MKMWWCIAISRMRERHKITLIMGQAKGWDLTLRRSMNGRGGRKRGWW